MSKCKFPGQDLIGPFCGLQLFVPKVESKSHIINMSAGADPCGVGEGVLDHRGVRWVQVLESICPPDKSEEVATQMQ